MYKKEKTNEKRYRMLFVLSEVHSSGFSILLLLSLFLCIVKIFDDGYLRRFFVCGKGSGFVWL